MQTMQALGRRLPPNALTPALQQAAPIVLGYIPVGFAYGVLAQKAGIDVWNTLFMSLFVYAGSAQLIAVGMIGAGAAPFAVIITTFIVNLRHLLMSAALAPHLKKYGFWQLAGFTAQLTDETFALHASRFATQGDTDDKQQRFAVNIIAHSSWVGGAWLGLAASGLIGDVKPLGLDYALPAMFLALLLGQIRSRTHALVACVAGLLALGLHALGCTQWHVILATVAAATLGLGVEQWTSRRSS